MKKDIPLISVILPVYNVEKYLDRCLESIVNQTYNNLEIILVDDGSPDNCPQMCDDWAKKDSRIKVIHKKNGGQSEARNFGLEIARGDYISLVDSDDYVAEDMIEVMYNRMLEDNSDLAICNYWCVSDTIDPKNFEWQNNLPVLDEVICADQAHKKLFLDNHWHYINPWGKLYKSFLFDGFKYPVGKVHEDLATTHLIFEKCSSISCIHRPLYYYSQNENSTTHTYSIKRLDAVDAYISRFWFYYNKNDWFCAIMNVQFMTEKLTAAHNMLDLSIKENKEKYDYCIVQYRKLLRKVIFKKVKDVDKFELISFYLGFFPYRVYKGIKRRVLKHTKR